MNRALLSGLASTLAHQAGLDVAANNLANVSTTGYKAGRVAYVDGFYQTLQSAVAGTESSGGTSAVQVGAGVSAGAVSTLTTQGGLEDSGRDLDAGIDGNGMFVVNGPSGVCFTRDGCFQLDASNTLVMATTGLRVQGWMATDGVTDPQQPTTDLTFPTNTLRSPRATTEVQMEGNLLSTTTSTDAPTTGTVTVYDSLGEQHAMTISCQKTANDREWDISVTVEGTTSTATVTFDDTGALPAGSSISVTAPMPNGAATLALDVDLQAMTQYAGGSVPSATSQDGYGAAALQNLSITDGGLVQGEYSDGRSLILGRIAVAEFRNPEGLQRSGNNLFTASAASGIAVVGAAGVDGRGEIVGQALESSNTDLTSSFLDMLITQRAYQASTRVISTANALLEETINLAR